jgi:hypothetical protein
MKTVVHAVPGTALAVRVPDAWQSTADPRFGLMSIEDVTGRFAASFTTVLDRSARELPPSPAAAAVNSLVAPVILDVDAREDGVDLLLCHLAGSISATARQRQVLFPDGLVVLTFTAATSRWLDLADLADTLLDSLEPRS